MQSHQGARSGWSRALADQGDPALPNRARFKQPSLLHTQMLAIRPLAGDVMRDAIQTAVSTNYIPLNRAIAAVARAVSILESHYRISSGCRKMFGHLIRRLDVVWMHEGDEGLPRRVSRLHPSDSSQAGLSNVKYPSNDAVPSMSIDRSKSDRLILMSCGRLPPPLLPVAERGKGKVP
jgi:hypothetical protein